MKPLSLIIKEGENAEFFCHYDYNLPTSWFFMENKLPSNAKIRNKHQLIIENATLQNSGYYECANKDKKDTLYARGQLKVIGKWFKESVTLKQ